MFETSYWCHSCEAEPSSATVGDDEALVCGDCGGEFVEVREAPDGSASAGEGNDVNQADGTPSGDRPLRAVDLGGPVPDAPPARAMNVATPLTLLTANLSAAFDNLAGGVAGDGTDQPGSAAGTAAAPNNLLEALGAALGTVAGGLVSPNGVGATIPAADNGVRALIDSLLAGGTGGNPLMALGDYVVGDLEPVLNRIAALDTAAYGPPPLSAEMREALPRMTMDADLLHDNPTCIICMGDFRDGDPVTFLPLCRHVFHPDCATPWFELHNTCPLCRAACVEHDRGDIIGAAFNGVSATAASLGSAIEGALGDGGDDGSDNGGDDGSDNGDDDGSGDGDDGDDGGDGAAEAEPEPYYESWYG